MGARSPSSRSPWQRSWRSRSRSSTGRPGEPCRKRFVALGTLKGRSRREIVRAVGEPSSETPLPDGRLLLQWRATGYHIALVFEQDGRCFGVTHENGRRVTGGSGRGAQEQAAPASPAADDPTAGSGDPR